MGVCAVYICCVFLWSGCVGGVYSLCIGVGSGGGGVLIPPFSELVYGLHYRDLTAPQMRPSTAPRLFVTPHHQARRVAYDDDVLFLGLTASS